MIIYENLQRMLYIADIYRRDGNYYKTCELLIKVAKELAKPIDFPSMSAIIEEEKRYNHNHDPNTGRFTGGPSPTGANVLEVQGFYSKAKLNNHWSKHGSLYRKDGIYTKEDFLERALTLAQSPVGGSIKGHLTKEGHIVRYDEKTNDFVKANVKKGIITMFKPKDGKLYYEDKRKGDLEHGGKN